MARTQWLRLARQRSSDEEVQLRVLIANQSLLSGRRIRRRCRRPRASSRATEEVSIV